MHHDGCFAENTGREGGEDGGVEGVVEVAEDGVWRAMVGAAEDRAREVMRVGGAVEGAGEGAALVVG